MHRRNDRTGDHRYLRGRRFHSASRLPAGGAGRRSRDSNAGSWPMVLVAGAEDPTPILTASPTPTQGPGGCPGDCDGNRVTSVNELIRAVNIALNLQAVTACPAADLDGSGSISIAELVTAVRAALEGCPA